jgi:alpha-galactosidase
MSLDVRRGDGAIELANDLVRARIELSPLSISMEGSGGRAAIHGCFPRVRSDAGEHRAGTPRFDGHGQIRTRLGAAQRVELRTGSEAGLELRLRLELGEDWPGFALELEVHNASVELRRVVALDPLAWGALAESELRLPGPPELWRFFRMGYQSWSPAGSLPMGGTDARPRLRGVEIMHQGPETPVARAGLHVSDFVTELRAPGHAGLALGFLTHERLLTHVSLEHRRGSPRALSARAAAEGLALEPGETLRAERLWVGFPDAEQDGIAQWAQRCGREMQAPVPAQAHSAWCSWYHYFTGVRAEDVRANAAALSQIEAPIEIVQIDDGYQAAVGDWLEWDQSFPEGIAPLAREIRASGFRAGLWLAPFIVSRASATFDKHPDWTLKSRGGRPRTALVHGSWKGHTCYALDPTHPGVQDWLRGVAERMRGLGFDYLKLDFLYAGALGGLRHDPSQAGAAAYRSGVSALRSGAGADAFLLGCGAPLGPSVGLFEAMRIGPDVAPHWRATASDLLYGIRSSPSAENSVRNVLARAGLHQRLWLNDPDCVLLRDRDTRLTESEVRALAGAIAVSGGLPVISDDLSCLGPARLRLLRKLLPAHGRVPEPLAGSSEIPEVLFARFPDQSVLLYALNLERRTRFFDIPLARLGLSGEAFVFDVLDERLLPGRVADRLRTEPVAPRGALLLRLSPADRPPRVVGSTLHAGAGAVETARLRADPTGSGCELRLVLPGPRRGRVWVWLGEDPPVPLEVGFRDRLDLRVDGTTVRAARS